MATRKKQAPPAAPIGESQDKTTAAAVVVAVDADVTAATNGLAAATNNPPALDMETEKARYNAALDSINVEETSVSGSRIREIPAVQTIDSVMKTVGAVYYRKTSAQTVKDMAAEFFPVLSDANGATDAALQSIMHCGMSRATAKNMLYLSRRDDLVTLVTSGRLPVSVAYRLAADSELDETAAAAAAVTKPALTPVTVQRWQVARVACQKIKPAWAAYDGARAQAETLPVGKERSAAAQRAALAWDNVAELWDTIHAARPATLREYDAVLCDVLTTEMDARKTAAAAAVETAAAAVQTAAEERAAAVMRAKLADELTRRLKSDLETAQESAAAAIREQLKTAAADATAANADATAAQEAETAAQTAHAKATAAAQRAALTAAAATATATKTTAAAAVTKPARPTAANMGDLVKMYRKLSDNDLRAELERITAAVSKAKKLAQWLAVGRAIELNVFE